ncbi:MAG: hypothetical protein F6J87_19865 [Spirulina sp. SIO3F2]|nr:hypothetical protein [Spirulina sp. SIO3F2]
MDSDRYNELSLNLKVQRNHPELLEGLEVWLQLGLISDAKVRAFCQQNLTCRRPRVSAWVTPPKPARSQTSSIKAEPSSVPVLKSSPQQAADRLIQPSQTPSKRDEKPSIAALKPSQEQGSDRLTQLLQSFITELNVLWLMLLGVFMVVVSSGVLAATRWRYLTPAGQYGLLFAYTLVFAAVAYDLNRRPKLQLTARMLRGTTLTLIPVNFWMIDQLNLFRSGEGWLVGVSAAFSLTVIMVVLLSLNRGTTSSPAWAQLSILNSVGLSWLHWGWGYSDWPGLALHSGMVVTGLILIYQDYKWGDRSLISISKETPASSSWGWLQPSRIAVVGGLLVLLFRALVVAHLPLSHMSVAIALGGFLLCWLGRRASPNVWFGLGVGLLLLGRGASLPIAFSVEALIISGLALVIVGERLHRRSQSVDLVCLLGIGLQALWPLRQLVSDHFQQQVVRTATNWAPSDVGMPIVLWGVGLFPYCFFILWLGHKLRQRRSGKLTQVAEELALGFGFCLTALSYINPLTRALNLILSAITLGVAIARRPHAQPVLLYLTQIVGWAALFTTVDLVQPNLSMGFWNVLLLAAMVGQWWVSGWGQPSRWQESAWHLGLFFSGISYVLWNTQTLSGWHTQTLSGQVLWLITPVMLTGLGDRPQWQQSRLAAKLSLLALIFAQPLTFPWTLTRFVGLGVSIALMAINTRILKGAIAGGVTIGFALTFLFTAFWELPQASIGLFLGCLAITILLLWFLSDHVGRYQWGQWYLKGLQLWAWTLTFLNLLVVSLGLGLLYGGNIILTRSELSPYHLILAMGVTTLAIAYHHRQHPADFRLSRLAACLNIVALIVAQPFTFAETPTRFLGLGLSIALMVINTHILKRAIAGGVTIGFGLAFLFTAFWELPQASIGLFLGYVSLTTLLLWFLQDQVKRYRWGRWYSKGLNIWAWMLNSLNLLIVSLGLGLVYSDTMALVSRELSPYHLILAMGVATLAIAYHHWRHPSEFSRFQVEWGVELWAASVLLLWDTSIVKLAIANLVLAALSLGVDTLWVRRTQRAYRASDQWIPLLYGFWGMVLGHHQFTAVTGIYTLIFSLLVMGIGRRHKGFQGLPFLAMASLSWGLYELLTYQLLQAAGDSPADGWLMFALLATVIAWCEYCLAPRLAWLVKLSIRELKIIAHLHGLGANGLAFWVFLNGLSPTGGISPTGEMIWISVVSALAVYGLLQGRRREDWIYVGILNGIAALSYGLYLTIPLSLLLQWGSALACLLAVGFYHLPWPAWGWSRRPWRRVALGLPLGVTIATMTGIGISSLLITGGLYAWFALQEKRPRISYLSVLLGVWATWRLLGLYQLQGMFAIACLVGGSLLYFAQIEPHLQDASARNQRHLIRSFATGLICLSALVESDAQFLWGFAAAGFFLVLILLGLLLRVRAFAYVGTLCFGFKVIRQLWLFVADQSFLLWAIGIVVGLLLIWVAATFEARRSQMTALLSYWVDELQSWA